MNVKKTIRRSTKATAYRAMAVHTEKMLAKGWKVDQEFGGDAGLGYECITWFCK